MAFCCRRNDFDEVYNNIEPIGLETYNILEKPNEPLINYKNSNFQTKKDLFIVKDKNYININMKWIKIESFKLFYMSKYIQCLNIKNINAKNEKKLILFSQCSLSNLGSIFPFLLDLSNHLKINILTYEYTNNKDEAQCYTDINVLYCYLSKLSTITDIILMGLSIGNIINMNIIISKIIKKLDKIKSFIMISPTWKYNYVDRSIKHKNGATDNLKKSLNIFFSTINSQQIKIFLIHGKQDFYVKYFLTLSLSQRIEYLSEWYPNNGSHFDILTEYRAKLLNKIKVYLYNNYSLSSLKRQNKINDKKIKIEEFIENNKEENNKNLDINIYHSINISNLDKEENDINNNSIIFQDSFMDKSNFMSFKNGDLIPTFEEKKKGSINLLKSTNSVFSFINNY